MTPQAPDQTSYLLGLVGQGISASLTPAMQEREGRECGLHLSYRTIDADLVRFGAAQLPDLLVWARRLGFDGLNITHPFKQAVVPLLDELSDDAADLGAVNTVVFRDGRMLGRNTDWSGYGRAFRQVLPDHVQDPVVLVGAGGAGVAVGYGLLEQGAAHVAVLDADRGRADACAVRLAKRFGDDRGAGPRQRHPDRHARPPRDGRAREPGARRAVGLRRRLLPARDRADPTGALARLPGRARRRDGRAPGGRGVRVLHRAGPGRRPDGPALRVADRGTGGLMRKGIATVSLSGVLATS